MAGAEKALEKIENEDQIKVWKAQAAIGAVADA